MLSKIIAIAGKGGTGKTTVASLLIRYLKQHGNTPVLAVDADADSNLPEALGMSGEKTIGTIGRARQEFFDSKGEVPAGMPKEAYLELKLNEVLVEAKDVDLMVMGRPSVSFQEAVSSLARSRETGVSPRTSTSLSQSFWLLVRVSSFAPVSACLVICQPPGGVTAPYPARHHISYKIL